MNEFSGVGIVGQDTANLGCGKKNVFRFFLFEKRSDCMLVGEVEVGVGAGDDVGVWGVFSLIYPLSPALSHEGRGGRRCGGGQATYEGGADQATVAGDVYFGIGLHDSWVSVIGCGKNPAIKTVEYIGISPTINLSSP